MSTLKGTTMHPRCRHIGETYLNVDFFSSSAQVKIQVKFNFELFWKTNQIFFGSHVVVLVKTFPLKYQLLFFLCRTGIVDKARVISFLGVTTAYVRKLTVRTEFNLVDFKLFEKKSHFRVSMV